MPIYEYRCESCGHQQEFLLKVSDAALTVCTKCGKPAFTKMVTAAGFQLKGSGWYATDFKNSGAKPASKATAAESSDAKGAGDVQGDAKVDTKTDTKSDSKSDSKSAADSKPAAPPATPASPKSPE